MSLKSIVLAAVVVTGMSLTAVQASPVWTLTAEGVISSGNDNAGVFGTVGQYLNGVAYKQTITVSIDASQYSNVSNEGSNRVALYGSFPGFTESITINGITQHYTITQPIYAQQLISTSRESAGSYQDQIYSIQYGNDNQQNQISGVIQAYTPYSWLSFVPAADFSQKVTALSPFVSTYSSAGVIDSTGHQQFYFYAYPDLITVNANQVANDVPEPASIALFSLGTLAIGAMRRRKKSKA